LVDACCYVVFERLSELFLAGVLFSLDGCGAFF